MKIAPDRDMLKTVQALLTKLTHFNCDDPGISLVENEVIHSNQLAVSSLQELQSTLIGLGYEDLEIRRAVRAVALANDEEKSSSNPQKNYISPDDTEAWIKATLLWLTQEAA